MNVLYQQGLESVAEELSRLGFHVHPMKSGVRADAVLFTSDAQGAFEVKPARGGTSVLNVQGMSAGEIASALSRRGCASLLF